MAFSGSPLKSNMQRSRGRSQGWAAFDRKQQEKQDPGPECDVDPYPSLSKINSSGSTKSSMTNHHATMKSYSSVVCPSAEFSVLAKSGNVNYNSNVKNQDGQITAEPNATPVKLLKAIHTWADQNLIEDILAALKNDVDQASILLKAMAPPESKFKETSHSGASSCTVNYPCEDINKCLGKSSSEKNKLSDGEVPMAELLFSIPVEPEWEEDDVYLSHRKDAIRMMRVASQHSRAASNAFSRGDHFSAHELSLRARGEWMTAEKLNAEAAKEILCIRNSSNDIWKIDLHGLHASEAVSALKEHLHRIESQIVMNRSASSDGLAKLEKAGISRSASSESVAGLGIDNGIKAKKTLPQQRQTVLHVITGTGNHSRGHASLPTVVRSFLTENGYRFDDARPGVIAVRPKFHHK